MPALDTPGAMARRIRKLLKEQNQIQTELPTLAAEEQEDRELQRRGDHTRCKLLTGAAVLHWVYQHPRLIAPADGAGRRADAHPRSAVLQSAERWAPDPGGRLARLARRAACRRHAGRDSPGRHVAPPAASTDRLSRRSGTQPLGPSWMISGRSTRRIATPRTSSARSSWAPSC